MIAMIGQGFNEMVCEGLLGRRLKKRNVTVRKLNLNVRRECWPCVRFWCLQESKQQIPRTSFKPVNVRSLAWEFLVETGVSASQVPFVTGKLAGCGILH